MNKNIYTLLTIRTCTNFADSLFYIMMIWYISETSSMLTGVAFLLFALPDSLSIFFGPILDRFSNKKLLFYALIFQLLIMISLTLLTLLHLLTIPIALLAIFLLTIFSELSYNIEQVLVPKIVKREKLLKANSFMSLTYQIGDFLFNGISGFLIAAFTLTGLNTVLFVVPLLFFKLFTFVDKKPVANKVEEPFNVSEYKNDILEGLTFLRRSNVFKLLLPLVLLNFCMSIINISIPYYSRELDSSGKVFGILMFLSGISGFLGILLLPKFEKKISLSFGKILAFTTILQGLLFFIFSISTSVNISFLFYFCSGIFSGAINVMYGTYFQAHIPSEIYGKANSSINTIISIAMPLGSLVGGFLLTVCSGSTLLVCCSIINLLIGIFYCLNPQIRNSAIYHDSL